MIRLLRLISLRHFALSPLRTGLTVLGVAVGVAVTVAIAAVNRSVLESFRSMVDTVSGKADLTVAEAKARFDDELLDKVAKVPGVAHAAGSMSFVFPVDGRPGESLYVLGTNFTDDGYFRDLRSAKGQPKLGDVLSFLSNTDELLLSERYAREHGLKAGDTLSLITLKGARTFKIRALLEESGPVKAFGGAFAVMDLYAAEAAFDLDHLIDRIDVAIAPTARLDDVRARIQAVTGPAFEVERPERRGESVQRMILSFQMGLNMGSALALLVGIFLVYNTVSIGVVQRRREIGTLRALGATASTMRGLFTLEAAFLGLLGAAVGIPLGWVIANRAIAGVGDAISSVYVQVHAADVHVSALEFAIGAALGIVGSAFAAFRPASAAASIQPVEALRKDVATGAITERQYRVQLVLGVVLLVASAILVKLPPPIENFPLGGYFAIFCVLMGATSLTPGIIRRSHLVLMPPAQALAGVPGRLATDNFSRAPGRSAVPVAALVIGVGMTIAVSGFIGSFKAASQHWLKESVPADLFVTSSFKIGGVRNVPMPADVGEGIRALPGVSSVDLIRLYQHDLMGLRIYVLSFNPEIYFEHAHPTFLEGNPAEARAATLRGDGVVISENLARRRNLHLGSAVEVPTPTGLKRYTVAAVIIDYTSDQGLLAMSRASFQRDFKDNLVDTFEVYVDDLGKRDGIRKAITSRYGAQYNLYVLTNDELRAESLELIDQTFRVTYAMEVVAVLLALLGVVNTLLAAVIDRTREIGLLRAVGATRSQVVKAIAAEAGCMGLLGAAIGCVAGTALTQVLLISIGIIGTGWEIPLTFPYATAIQMCAASIFCAVAAGLYPARRAAGLDVVEALAYE